MRKLIDDGAKLIAACMLLFLILNVPYIAVSVPQGNVGQQHANTEGTRNQPHSWWYSFFWDIRVTDTLLALFTGALVLVGYIQAKRLRESIRTQTADMEKTVGEAKRSADAMERVADSIAISAQSAKESVATSKEISAKQQKLMRAYVSTTFAGIVSQNPPNIRFEPRFFLTNNGNTPAYNLRSTCAADVLDEPLPADFAFPLPGPSPRDGTGNLGPHQQFRIGATVPRIYSDAEIEEFKRRVTKRLYAWGMISYDDAFGDRQTVRFAQSFAWQLDGNIVGFNASRNNEAT